MNAKLSTDEIQEIVSLGLSDPGFFCRSMLSEWFSLPMPWVHRGVLAILTRQTDWLLKFGPEQWAKAEGVWDEPQLEKIIKHFTWRADPDDLECPAVPLFEAERDAQGKVQALHLYVADKTLLILPRGVSKTTLVNAVNVRDIVNHDVDFLVYLSETATHSEQQLENVQRQLETNPKILAVYGDKKPARNDPESWTDSLFETTDGVVVAAKGRGGQVRGMNHNGKRPSRIIFDDVEDKESVKTEDQRQKARVWLKSDVEQALPQIGDGRRELIGLGTILHHDALVVSLSKDPEWLVVKFGAKDPDGEMLWEHYLTEDEYNRKRRSFIRLGQLPEFTMEYDSSTRVEDDNAKFQGPFIYKPMERSDFVGVALACDPAISKDRTADFCSFGVTGMTERGQHHVLDFYAERGMHPRAQIDKFFELHFRWDPTHHGVESIAYQQALIHMMTEEMFRKGKTFGPKAYFEIEPIKHGTQGKIPRVEGVLATRMSAGYVSFQRRWPLLEEQLLDWPNSKLDGPDVIAMCITLLDPFAPFALEGDEDGSDQLAKDQYPPLALELGNWRTAP